jgi:hypothetical protein
MLRLQDEVVPGLLGRRRSDTRRPGDDRDVQCATVCRSRIAIGRSCR